MKNLFQLIPLMLMGSYDESCGGSAGADSSVVTNGGIANTGATGPLQAVVATDEDFSFASTTAAKIKSNWDDAVFAGDLLYVGEGEFENSGEDEERFTNANLKIDILINKGTKTLTFTQVRCACTHKELLKLNGKTKRFFFFTSLDFIRGRIEDDGTVKGLLGQVQFGKRDFATQDTPYDPTVMTITFDDFESDERNPWTATADFEASEIDKIDALDATFANISSDGSTLSADVTIQEDCDDSPFTGLTASDIQVLDENGNALTVASFTEVGSTGVYSLNVTTALTKAILTTANATRIVKVNTFNYHINPVTFQTS